MGMTMHSTWFMIIHEHDMNNDDDDDDEEEEDHDAVKTRVSGTGNMNAHKNGIALDRGFAFPVPASLYKVLIKEWFAIPPEDYFRCGTCFACSSCLC